MASIVAYNGNLDANWMGMLSFMIGNVGNFKENLEVTLNYFS